MEPVRPRARARAAGSGPTYPSLSAASRIRSRSSDESWSGRENALDTVIRLTPTRSAIDWSVTLAMGDPVSRVAPAGAPLNWAGRPWLGWARPSGRRCAGCRPSGPEPRRAWPGAARARGPPERPGGRCWRTSSEGLTARLRSGRVVRHDSSSASLAVFFTDTVMPSSVPVKRIQESSRRRCPEGRLRRRSRPEPRPAPPGRRARRRGRRGRCPRRTRRARSARGHPVVARRAITRTPRLPRIGTCLWSSTVAVTRSRTSSSSRPGSVRMKEYAGRGSPQVPTSLTLSVRSRGPSRRPRPAPRGSGRRRGGRAPIGCRRRRRTRPRPRPAPSPPPRPRRPGRYAGASLLPDDPVAQLAAVLLERGELTEHPVERLGVLDRVGALQLRLEVGDPAQRRELEQADDVQSDVGDRGLLLQRARPRARSPQPPRQGRWRVRADPPSSCGRRHPPPCLRRPRPAPTPRGRSGG